MLSILIPTYNFPCYPLVEHLYEQAQRLSAEGDFSFEILVSDDASDQLQVLKENSRINSLKNCRLILHESNQGRAMNCNELFALSSYPYLLIVDDDAEVCREDFLRTYWEHRNEGDVICGGLLNPEGEVPEGCELRYVYEHGADERRKLAFRRQYPEEYLSTFNIFMRRGVFEAVQFDERCTEYGYEDALWGLEIFRRGFSIFHIDNPLIHTGIDTNESFLKKTQASLRVLARLDGVMQERSGVARLAGRLKKWRILPVARWALKGLLPALERHLLGRKPRLWLFNLYKLGVYLQVIRH